jgi:DNA ligase-1
MVRSDIRKCKKWQDAEYTVVDVENSRMRLAVNGVYGEYDAMANIWIEHKGVRVSVGSGFTTDQRIQFGKNPDLIVSDIPSHKLMAGG